ncbi:hypothetical protein [Thermoplasma volcanium GSS1]|uniref:Mechanosensitive ion channel MscS domain-containing protein n=1 Tax=Thermoplasma volcanium (strain ATCC 51530 / DSM 4299 / JCM 9571 / NBRC 15438 / GSS1) TaxID=273116 RepID=Q97AH5_THEVO|nr:mechanosensitive ion channel family protein [Thermoplasma volcanium]BAB59977.1 hypothetical protein [Thermoplasma volcanium GSS1]
MDRAKGKSIAVYVGSMIVLIIVLLALLYVLSLFHIVPIKFSRILYAVVIGLVIYAIVRIVTKYVERFISLHSEFKHLKYIVFIISLLGYFIISLAVLAALGIDVSSVILGSAFLSAIIGLAAQSVLANVFGGLFLSIVRPFKLGDHIVVNTWQFPVSFPSYPPKYFSRDFIEGSIYRGIVSDISINYTSIALESGDVVKIPNNIMIQAAITLRHGSVTVQARYEVPKYINFNDIYNKIVDEVGTLPGARNIGVMIDETTVNTYIILVRGDFQGEDADLVRSQILQKVIGIVEPLKKQ